ncbi:transposase zinc-binding domain-containing protein, partial [Escherichia coli]|nr:transposase zinc-binding domain-containing protein [Escherichia coli]
MRMTGRGPRPPRTGGLRDIEVEAVTKMLACGTRILGVKEYNCDKPECPHVRYVTNS